jgi:RNA polymerase sigma-70 factor, ECF subfamily
VTNVCLAAAVSRFKNDDLIAIDDALRALAAQYERKSQVVELRFFGGLSVEETAEVLKISPETVMRDWRFAKNWLLRELSRTKNGR